jgi:hypothetical protein
MPALFDLSTNDPAGLSCGSPDSGRGHDIINGHHIKTEADTADNRGVGMTDEQRIELVLLQYRTATHPEVRHYDQEVVEDHLAYLMAHGLLERRYGKANRKGARTSSTALSPEGQKRLDELKALVERAATIAPAPAAAQAPPARATKSRRARQ